jgi:hypothetical protein
VDPASGWLALIAAPTERHDRALGLPGYGSARGQS